MRAFAFLCLTLSGVFWGLGFPLGKLVLRETGPAHLVLLRFAVAAVAAPPFALRPREARALSPSPAVLAAGGLYGVAFMVQFEGLARTTVALSPLLVGVMPPLVALWARAMGEPMSRTSWTGV